MKSTAFLAAAGLMLLAGCESSNGSRAIRPLPAALVGASRVVSVEVTGNNTRGLGDAFRQTVQARVDRCARGETPLTLQVSVESYDGANPGMALLFPTPARISGSARLLDASGAVVGEYHIERSLTAGGLAGAAIALQSDSNMSNAFGDEICRRAFGRETHGNRTPKSARPGFRKAG